MVKQYSLNQTSEEADWLIGEGIFTSAVNGVALRSMKAPGTAYDDPVVGKDIQPAHMDDYNNTSRDNGGVHINSGIPNRAFYLAAVALGGNSWDRAGKIWYEVVKDPSIRNSDGGEGATRIDFKTFADATVKHALSLYDEDAQGKVRQAWVDVGVLMADSGNGEL
jgi:Zn-dependent metalloprotease